MRLGILTTVSSLVFSMGFAIAGTNVSGGGGAAVCFNSALVKQDVETALKDNQSLSTASDVLRSVVYDGGETAFDRITRVSALDLFILQYTFPSGFMNPSPVELRDYDEDASQEEIFEVTLERISKKLPRAANEIRRAGKALEWYPAKNGVYSQEEYEFPFNFPSNCLAFPVAWQILESIQSKQSDVFHDSALIAKMPKIHQASLRLHEATVRHALLEGHTTGAVVMEFVGNAFTKQFDETSGIFLAELLPEGFSNAGASLRLGSEDFATAEHRTSYGLSYVKLAQNEEAVVDGTPISIKGKLLGSEACVYRVSGGEEELLQCVLAETQTLPTPIGPVEFLGDTDVYLDRNGIVYRGHLAEDFQYSFGDGQKATFVARTPLLFWHRSEDDEGVLSVSLAAGTLKNDTVVVINNEPFIFKAGGELKFLEDGQRIRNGQLALPAFTKIAGREVMLPSKSIVTFHESGNLDYIFLPENESISLSGIENVSDPFLVTETIGFHPNGQLSLVELVERTPLHSFNGLISKATAKRGTSLYYHDDGSLLAFVPDQDVTIDLGGNSVSCQRSKPVYFHSEAEGGQLSGCTIARDKIYVDFGQRWQLEAGELIEFGPTGRPHKL